MIGTFLRDFLVSLRFLGFLWQAPLLGNPAIPWPSRLGLSLLLGLALGGIVAPHYSLPANLLSFAFVGGRELVLGLAIGFTANILFSVVQYGGGLMDMSLGFGMIQVIDPNYGQVSSLTGSFLTILALLLYMATGADRLTLLALIQAYRWLPLGGGHLGGGAVAVVVKETGAIFADGLLVALPTISMVLLAEVALSLIGRLVPQFNVFMFALGLQPALVLLGLAASFGFLLLFIRFLFQGLESDLLVFLRGLG